MPFDDQRQGLSECPALPFTAEMERDAFGIPSISSDGSVVPLFKLDRAELMCQLEIASRHGAAVERATAAHDLLPSVLAGLCSRRSGWGRKLEPEGPEGTTDMAPRRISAHGRASFLPPDGLGFERGLMALDFDRHDLAQGPHWRDPAQSLEAAAAIVAQHRTTLRRRTTLQGSGLLRASLAAFEVGLERVQRAIRLGQDVDAPTVGRGKGGLGCGRDVLARASFFQAHGWD